MAFAVLAHKWVTPRAESLGRVEDQASHVVKLLSGEAALIYCAGPPVRLLKDYPEHVERLQSLLHIRAALLGDVKGAPDLLSLRRGPSGEQLRSPTFIEDGLSGVRRIIWPDLEEGSKSVSLVSFEWWIC